MNRREMLLTILAEECAEVTELVSKSLRFGDDSTYDNNISNSVWLTYELCDLLAVYEMLVAEGILPNLPQHETLDRISRKIDKVEHYMKISKDLGTLSDN